MAFVAFGAAGECVGVGAGSAAGSQRPQMVLANSLNGAAAGEDAFAAAAVAHHIVVDDAARENDPVRFCHQAVDGNFGAPAGFAEIHHIRLVPGVMVEDAHAVADGFAAESDKFACRILPVAADDNKDGNVFIRHAGQIQFIQQKGQDLVHILPGAGNIAYGDDDSFSRTNQFAQRRAVDGMGQGLAYGAGDIFDRRILAS